VTLSVNAHIVEFDMAYKKVVRGPFVTSAVVAKRTFLETKVTTEYE